MTMRTFASSSISSKRGINFTTPGPALYGADDRTPGAPARSLRDVVKSRLQLILHHPLARCSRPKRYGNGDHCDQYEQPYGNQDDCVARHGSSRNRPQKGVRARLNHAASTTTDHVNVTVSPQR